MDKLTKIIVEHTITCLMFLIVGINSLCAQELEAPLVHTVLFWLHHPESKDDQLLFEKAINKIASLPTFLYENAGVSRIRFNPKIAMPIASAKAPPIPKRISIK